MNPADHTYFIDRTDFAGGDNGFECPIATCSKGTWFASFARGHLLERDPLSRMTEVDTGRGWRGLTYQSVPSAWDVGGHNPHVILRDCHVPTVPIFVDDGPPAVGVRIEGHEQPIYKDGKHFPIVIWETDELRLGQGGYNRVERPTKLGNHGDSSTPCFAKVGDKIGFVGQEVFLGGGRTNSIGYIETLRLMKKFFPDTTWEELRWSPDDTGTSPDPSIPPPDDHVCPEPVIIEKIVEVYPVPLSLSISYQDGTVKTFDIEE